MKWFAIYARGHHGYPQPEDNYEQSLYSEICLRCGYHSEQVAPFRIRRTNKANNSNFLQLNWVFDAFFVSPNVREQLMTSTLNGIAFKPVIEHKSGEEIDERIQLLVTKKIKCIEVSQLPKVKCCANNEESAFETPGEKRYPECTPYCGRVKYHPPTSIALMPSKLSNAPDIFQTEEFFGSGGVAFNLTLCSEVFMNFVRIHKWRGLSFVPVATSGYSKRAV